MVTPQSVPKQSLLIPLLCHLYHRKEKKQKVAPKKQSTPPSSSLSGPVSPRVRRAKNSPEKIAPVVGQGLGDGQKLDSSSVTETDVDAIPESTPVATVDTPVVDCGEKDDTADGPPIAGEGELVITADTEQVVDTTVGSNEVVGNSETLDKDIPMDGIAVAGDEDLATTVGIKSPEDDTKTLAVTKPAKGADSMVDTIVPPLPVVAEDTKMLAGTESAKVAGPTAVMTALFLSYVDDDTKMPAVTKVVKEVAPMEDTIASLPADVDEDMKMPATTECAKCAVPMLDTTVSSLTDVGFVLLEPYASRKKQDDVVSILDDEDRQHIIELLDEDENALLSKKQHYELTDEAGTVVMDETGAVVQKKSEEDFWMDRMKRARQQNANAEKLLLSTRNKAGQANKAEAKMTTYGLMIPLPAAEKAVVEEVLYSNVGDVNAVVQRAGGNLLGAKPYLTRADIHTLRPCEWVAEAVIDYYMHCLRERQNKQVKLKQMKKLHVCHFFRTAFYSKIHPDEFSSTEDYHFRLVRSWTRQNVPNGSIFKCDALFFPANIGRRHWILIVAFIF
jgi:hypothetical protein